MSDYASTARALALPVTADDLSPITSNTTTTTTTPPWHRRGPSYGRTAPPTPSTTAARYKARLLASASALHRRGRAAYVRLTPLQRALFGLGLVIALVLTALFLVYNERIFAALAPAAQRWHNVRGGWLVLFAATCLVSFPPLIGYSTCLTVAGFVYGFPHGWFIVAPATVIGSSVSFLACRTVLRRWTAALAHEPRFAAFAATLAHDGLPLLIMLRLCPLPYSLSNGAIASFPTVSVVQFALATALVTPKLLVHVFIGARLAALAGGEMDAHTRLVNYAGIGFGVVVGAVTGWVIYRKTKARAREVEEMEAEEAAAAAAAGTGGAPGGRGRRFGHVRGYLDEEEEVGEGVLRETPDDISLKGAPGAMFGLDEGLDDGFEDDAEGAGGLEDGYRDGFSDLDEEEDAEGFEDREAVDEQVGRVRR